MQIMRAAPSDASVLAAIAACVWEADPADLAEEFAVMTAGEDAACFLAVENHTPVGFAQCQLRHDYVEGCETSPVDFLEGIYVEEAYRRTGVARKLLTACEDWARAKGCTEFASDCEIDNHDSLAWHLHSGFEEMGRTIWFAKKL